MSGNDAHAEHHTERRKIAMIAVAWFARMRSDERSPDDERKFRAWLDADEAHAAAYANVEKMWSEAGCVEALPGLHAMRQEALQARSRHLARFWGNRRRFEPLPRPRAMSGRRAVACVAAALALMIAGGQLVSIMLANATANHIYQTASGERTTQTLADGSLVTLSSDSKLAEEFSENMRRVVLIKGAAFFDVAHDPDRPFTVEAGSGMVTALGTEFDVYKKNGEVVVTLIEGSVEVAALHQPSTDDGTVRQLQVGERIFYGRSGLSEVHKVDIEQAISWRNGRILAENEPLLDVIDEMNRHSRRQLVVDRNDPRMRTLLVNGQFKTGRPDALVEYLRAGGYQVWVAKDVRGNISLRLRGTPADG